MSVINAEPTINNLASQYETALQAYLSGDGEEVLQQAYELGRAAMQCNFGVLDVIELHHVAVETILSQKIPGDDLQRQMKGALVFLEECLSPYEIAHRAYRDAVALKHHITRFTSVACHEVKAPLTSILSSAGMLQELLEAEQGSPENKLLSNLLKGVEILGLRTADMMDIASLYSGTLSIRTKSVSIPDFLWQVYDHLEPEVRWQGMELVLYIDENIPRAEFDPGRIEQVITNLVQNAIKYAADGGVIDLAASTRDDNLIIEVRDYGNSGAPGEHIREVLSDRLITRDSQARGTGLGLILCRELIEAHHGRITVSGTPGKGHIFQLCLPLVTRP